MEEIWEWVPGREGRYKVSNHGRVKSYLFSQTGKMMKLDLSAQGYYRVHFQFKATWLVHRLVATTFLPNPLDLPAVNHKDGDKRNNAVSNLEWVTYSDNMKHSWRNLETYKNRVAVCPRGEANCNAKLTEAQVKEIRAAYVPGKLGTWKLAKQYGVTKPAIVSILRRKTWKHVA